MLATHFLNLVVTKEVVAHAAACRNKRCDWWVAAEVVTYSRVEWISNSFSPYKSLGMDGFTAGMGDCHSEPGQDISCLPGYGLCSSHMVPG